MDPNTVLAEPKYKWIDVEKQNAAIEGHALIFRNTWCIVNAYGHALVFDTYFLQGNKNKSIVERLIDRGHTNATGIKFFEMIIMPDSPSRY